MATFLDPYLHVEGVARDAITFYASVFGGEPSVMTYGELGMDGPDAVKVMHSQLDRRDVGVQVMASDYLPGMGADSLPANGMLADGGEVHEPLSVKPWGDEFGQVQDRFGVIWVMNIAVAG